MLKQWCEITSCNGVIDLYLSQENKKHFIFWTVVMIVMFSASVFFTYRTIIGYVETPTVTNVDTATSASVELPQVLLSYNGGLNVAALREEGFSEEFILAFTVSFDPHTVLSSNNTELMKQLATYMAKKNFGYIDVAKKFGYKCEDMITEVIEPDLTHHNCTKAKYFLTHRGSSYIYKSDSPQWYPGMWGGMKFLLKAPKDSFVQMHPDKAFRLDMNEEFSITLEKSFGHFISARSYIIPLNTKVEITINPKQYTRINGTRQCAGSENLFTSNTCFFDCWIAVSYKCWGCVPYLAYADGFKYNQSEICNPLKYYGACIYDDENKECDKSCLPLCNEWIYEATLAYSPLTWLSDNESVSIVVVGYSTMQYTKIEQAYAFTIDMAISNVGGQSGLWLGISVITIIQGFYYLVIALFQKIGRGSNVQKLNGNQSLKKGKY